MASSFKKVPSDRVTERATHALARFVLTLTDQNYVTPTVDMGDVGALTIGCMIKNPGATTLKYTPQVSMDGIVWTNIEWKTVAGVETASGEQDLLTTANIVLCVHFTDYPEYLCHRYFRVYIKSNTTPTAANASPEIYVVLK